MNTKKVHIKNHTTGKMIEKEALIIGEHGFTNIENAAYDAAGLDEHIIFRQFADFKEWKRGGKLARLSFHSAQLTPSIFMDRFVRFYAGETEDALYNLCESDYYSNECAIWLFCDEKVDDEEEPKPYFDTADECARRVKCAYYNSHTQEEFISRVNEILRESTLAYWLDPALKPFSVNTEYAVEENAYRIKNKLQYRTMIRPLVMRYFRKLSKTDNEN